MAGSSEELRARFATRFEPDGEGYLFRANLAVQAYRKWRADGAKPPRIFN
jgi:hypothetical protein